MYLKNNLHSVVQGADWHWGPTQNISVDKGKSQPTYIRDSALATFILASVLFFAYLVVQVCGSIVQLHCIALLFILD